MKIFVIGLLLGCLLVPLIGFVYLRFGYTPVAVDGPVIPFEELLAGTAIQAKIAREAPVKADLPPSPENLVRGAEIYRKNCVECHGLPGSQPTASAKGMFPEPPQFFERRTMGNDPVGQNYWIVKNGIRLSGMPGYKNSLNETELWQVSQFLSHRASLPQAATDELGKGIAINPVGR